MAKKQKAVKIKRYKNTMTNSKSKAQGTFKKVFIVIVSLSVVVGLGFLLGEPVMNFLTSSNNNEGNTNSQVSVQSEDNQNLEENIETEEETQTATPIIQVDNKVYYNANVNQLLNEDTLASLIDVLNSKNATHCIIPIKDVQGYVYYDSENEYANQAKNELILNPEMVINTLRDNGIQAVASVSVFRDNLITVLNRNTSIFYLNTDSRWLDNEFNAGGQAWANPANSETQDYIKTITEEVINFGFKEILFLNYQIPHSGYLAGMDFKVTEEELQNEMSEFSNELVDLANEKGVHTIFGVDFLSIKSNDYQRYTQNPLEMFNTSEVVFLARTDSFLLEEDTALINSLANENNINSVGLWITDIAPDQIINDIDNFVIR